MCSLGTRLLNYMHVHVHVYVCTNMSLQTKAKRTCTYTCSVAYKMMSPDVCEQPGKWSDMTHRGGTDHTTHVHVCPLTSSSTTIHCTLSMARNMHCHTYRSVRDWHGIPTMLIPTPSGEKVGSHQSGTHCQATLATLHLWYITGVYLTCLYRGSAQLTITVGLVYTYM